MERQTKTIKLKKSGREVEFYTEYTAAEVNEYRKVLLENLTIKLGDTQNLTAGDLGDMEIPGKVLQDLEMKALEIAVKRIDEITNKQEVLREILNNIPYEDFRQIIDEVMKYFRSAGV